MNRGQDQSFWPVGCLIWTSLLVRSRGGGESTSEVGKFYRSLLNRLNKKGRPGLVLVDPYETQKTWEVLNMKYRRAEVHSKAHKIPDLKFEQQSLTSFAGLIVFQQLFKALGFRGQLRGCCRHVKGRRVYGLATVFFQLIIHILLGYRERT